MTRKAEGVWSVTTMTLEADIYPYRFEIDGLSVIDPANPLITGGYAMTAGQSLLTVPGQTGAPGTVYQGLQQSQRVA